MGVARYRLLRRAGEADKVRLPAAPVGGHGA